MNPEILRATEEASDRLEQETAKGLAEIRSLSAKIEIAERWKADSELWAYQRPFRSSKP